MGKEQNDNFLSLEDMRDALEKKISDQQKPLNQKMPKSTEEELGRNAELKKTSSKSKQREEDKTSKNVAIKDKSSKEQDEDFKRKSKKNFEKFLNEKDDIFSHSKGDRGHSEYVTGEILYHKMNKEDAEKFKQMRLSDTNVKEYGKFRKKRLEKTAQFELKRNNEEDDAGGIYEDETAEQKEAENQVDLAKDFKGKDDRSDIQKRKKEKKKKNILFKQKQKSKQAQNEDMPKKGRIQLQIKEINKDGEELVDNAIPPKEQQSVDQTSYYETDKQTDFIPDEQENLEIEYRDEKDKKAIQTYLFENKADSLKATIALGIIFVVTFAWYFLNFMEGNVPTILTPQQPFSYLLINLIVMLIGGYFAVDTLKSGMGAIYNKSADRNSVVLVAYASATIFNIALFFSNNLIASEKNIFLFTPIIIGSMFFKAFSDLIGYTTTINNFDLLNEKTEKYALNAIDDQHLASAYVRGKVDEEPVVVVNKPAGFIKNFIRNSLKSDLIDNLCYYLLPIGIGVSFISLVVFIALTGDIWYCLNTFLAIIISFSSFGVMASTSLIQRFVFKRTNRWGIFIGPSVAYEFGDLNAITINCSDLFPSGCVSLKGMRVFNKQSIYESIICCASLLKESNSVLKDMFIQIMLNKDEYLHSADNIVYEDNLGISGWVLDKHIIVGNKDMMLNHNIEIPSQDEIQKLVKPDTELIFVSIDGKLASAFVFSLKPSIKIKRLIDKVYDLKSVLVIQTVDPFITSEQLATVFLTDEKIFKILPARYHDSFVDQTKKAEEVSSCVINNGDIESYIKVAVESKKIKSRVLTGVVIMMISIFVQVALVFIMAFTGKLFEISTTLLFVYQLISVLAINLAGILKS